MPIPQPKAGTEHRPAKWFILDPRELARHDNPVIIRQRGLDMLANGQLQPVGATEDRRLIFGHGRVLSALSAEIETVETKIYPASLTETQFRLIRAAENFQRTDLTAYQKWVVCAELMECNPEWQFCDLAEHLHVDPSMVTRLLSPSKCIPDWQAAFKEGKVGISDVYAASKRPESEQAGLLALKLSGASRDAIERAGKNKRTITPPVKVNKLKCDLPSGMHVAISGQSVSLDEAIEALAEVLKSARKAREDGLTAKSWTAAMKDKARVKA
jgi:ParB family chromosome partitioning protein